MASGATSGLTSSAGASASGLTSFSFSMFVSLSPLVQGWVDYVRFGRLVQPPNTYLTNTTATVGGTEMTRHSTRNDRKVGGFSSPFGWAEIIPTSNFDQASKRTKEAMEARTFQSIRPLCPAPPA